MLNILVFLMVCIVLLLFYGTNSVNSLVSFFFLSEILWITCFTLSTLLGVMYDDISLFGFLVIILFITAFEVGLISLFIKIFHPTI